MSQQAFQAAVARLLLETGFRDVVRDGTEIPGDHLTEIERRRLVAIANDPGLDVTRTLHDGWRLSKVLLMLPMTCLLLGDVRLAAELTSFWRGRVPRSLYFHDEAIAFCDHVLARPRSRLRLTYLDEVVAFERALLELQRPWAGGPPAPQRVVFRHEPQALLGALAEGRRPRGVPEELCVLVGTSPAPGQVEWRLAVPAAAQTLPVSTHGESTPLTPAVS